MIEFECLAKFILDTLNLGSLDSLAFLVVNCVFCFYIKMNEHKIKLTAIF